MFRIPLHNERSQSLDSCGKNSLEWHGRPPDKSWELVKKYLFQEDRSLILFPVKSFPCPAKSITTAFSIRIISRINTIDFFTSFLSVCDFLPPDDNNVPSAKVICSFSTVGDGHKNYISRMSSGLVWGCTSGAPCHFNPWIWHCSSTGYNIVWNWVFTV